MRHIPGIDVRTYVGKEILPVAEELSGLRQTVFRDWPYLYDGDRSYERDYLAAYATSPRSVCVVARDESGRAVGASTGMPLADEGEAFRRPFEEHGIAPDDVFYFGESVLLAPWRGRGIGHAFFDAREARARASGTFRWTAFCSVRREPGDTRKPANYHRNDAFWLGRGYKPAIDLSCTLSWKEIGADAATPHTLDFWMRELDREHA
ncbi:GNAT family N-acetyltransferase [Luteibacter sp. RCC_6_2]|uniref:GNAT family N-acetyltransferase n=1 Tax=Luteibacter sp. RCC_6_2 TaxID=3239223 RepID=UPI003525627E